MLEPKDRLCKVGKAKDKATCVKKQLESELKSMVAEKAKENTGFDLTPSKIPADSEPDDLFCGCNSCQQVYKDLKTVSIYLEADGISIPRSISYDKF